MPPACSTVAAQILPRKSTLAITSYTSYLCLLSYRHWRVFFSNPSDCLQKLDPLHLEDSVRFELVNLDHHGKVEGYVDISIYKILIKYPRSIAYFFQLIHAHERRLPGLDLLLRIPQVDVVKDLFVPNSRSILLFANIIALLNKVPFHSPLMAIECGHVGQALIQHHPRRLNHVHPLLIAHVLVLSHSHQKFHQLVPDQRSLWVPNVSFVVLLRG